MDLKYIISKFLKKMMIPAVRASELAITSVVCSGSHVVNAKVGKYSYIGNGCTVVNTEIGNYCSIADNCIIGGANHPLNWVSTSPVFYTKKNVMRHSFCVNEFEQFKKTIIGSDVWIGTNCLIKNGIIIECGAVIGMGSVVTKNVGAYEIWAGNPAKLIRKRFPDDVIKCLLSTKWWEWSDDVIRQKAPLFNKVQEFVTSIGG